jgi:parallel beta-helix repeat protein
MKRQWLVIVILLLLVVTNTHPLLAKNIEKIFQPLSRENRLYVGGSGPGNYTKIQDAIDNASDDDTVFVYNISSPYNENLIINKSIQLNGCNWENTIIDGGNNSNTIHINHNNTTVSNFTIRNCGEIRYLILINSCNNVTIHHNILTANNSFGKEAINVYNSGNMSMSYGIVIRDNIIKDSFYGISTQHCSIRIENNLIENIAIYGIYTYASSNTVTNNTIRNCYYGIYFKSTIGNKIFYNKIFNCSTGISLSGYDHVIQWNELNGCRRYGIFNDLGRKNEIHFNNFVHNNQSVFFRCHFPKIIYFNYWNRNYWDDHQSNSPRKIPGTIVLWTNPYDHTDTWSISWFQFDWRPSQEPYDISGMR